MAEGDGGERLEDTIWREVEEMCARYDGWTWVCADRGDHYWQLFVYGPPIYHTLVAEDGTETRCALPTPDSSHGLQVLKAAKTGTPYAEYWPDSHQQRYIMAALNGLPLLLKRVKELENMFHNRNVVERRWLRELSGLWKSLPEMTGFDSDNFVGAYPLLAELARQEGE